LFLRSGKIWSTVHHVMYISLMLMTSTAMGFMGCLEKAEPLQTTDMKSSSTGICYDRELRIMNGPFKDFKGNEWSCPPVTIIGSRLLSRFPWHFQTPAAQALYDSGTYQQVFDGFETRIAPVT
jgi:hypothetical protein